MNRRKERRRKERRRKERRRQGGVTYFSIDLARRYRLGRLSSEYSNSIRIITNWKNSLNSREGAPPVKVGCKKGPKLGTLQDNNEKRRRFERT
jgi:hypothetical protein